MAPIRKRAGIALAALLAAAPARAGWLNEAERAAFGAELRDYLLDHPEVIEEALSGAEARRYQGHVDDDLSRIAAHADALFRDPADWVGGNPAGDVPLVLFLDYSDAASARALSAARKLAETDAGLRLVVKEAPAPGNAVADRAARLARAVLALAGPEAYPRAQDMLFAAPDTAPGTLAAALSLDPAALAARTEAPETAAALTRARALAVALDLGPPPAYVLERSLVRGDLPAVALAPIVEAMRRKK